MLRFPPRTSSMFGILLLCGVLVVPSGTATAFDPLDPSTRRALATVDSLRAERNFQTALARLDQLAREHPQTVEVLWRQSILWSDVGKAADETRRAVSAYRRALSFADKAIEADSSSAWAHVAKAVAAGRVARLIDSNRQSIRQSREVKEHADRALALDSTLAAAYHVRARWHREVADLNFVQRIVVKTVYGGLPEASMEQAVRDFQTACRLETRTYHHLELGKTYLQMGRPDAARDELRTALETRWADPFDPEYKREARTLLQQLP